MSRICVVIPHCGYAEGLARVLAAVAQWPVLLVDATESGLSQDLEGIDVVRVGGGGGFSVAVNAGLARAEELGFERVLVLNDDAIPEPDCIAILMAHMDSDARCGAVGPLLIGPQGVESAGLSYSMRTGRVVQLRRVPNGVAEVDALSGACLLIGTQERFDTGFPHGFEDVDLALRIRNNGWTVVIEPAARCWHEGGGTLNRRSRQAACAAITGHLRLVGDSRVRRQVAVLLALAQVVRERGPMERFFGVWEGYRASEVALRAAAIASGSAGSNSIM